MDDSKLTAAQSYNDRCMMVSGKILPAVGTGGRTSHGIGETVHITITGSRLHSSWAVLLSRI